ncbi:class I SAM-dependent DNA methyltransferase [Bacillus licheniformis]|uniref:HsdM family class I SAM-dependent methyltransferase n=1 Tax=Bacillus licheniformis TaxID=1402 RepID=UPI000B8B5773|nr:N-6 DNA methylase [Bacillus licheniformis]MED0689971.1 N-6 DNA methylase [Bacillus licheniformis]MED0713571.1 N-6 DNA methylase [Bacillus licheniformis]MED0789312.1 N-6 DNA methylase [Bacillus licheniformis]TWM10439.1 Restriction enzyme BgcI subunit alpha [Bacillus licheniformis]WIW99395.1 N-6 DNA methylase [Bacillus licheniformis]
MPNERTATDQFVRKQIEELGVTYDEQGSSIIEVREALSNGSKTGKGGVGKPEFVFVVKDFLIIVEDKLSNDKIACFNDEQELDMSTKAKVDYALNGAVHYAKHIAENSSFKRVFAIGITGSEKHHIIQPAFVSDKEVILLDEIETLENFKEENIERYYSVEVLKETPPEEQELKDILSLSKDLHESLRNYGQLSEREKPLVVSAIMLALQDKDNFEIKNLNGNQVQKDGKKIFDSLSNYLDIAKVHPEVKKRAILDEFSFIKTRVTLNTKNESLGNKTPLRYFTEYIDSKILHIMKGTEDEDILGRFYGEFVKYSDGDANGLGIVLTPSHITTLMCELVDIKPDDVVLDPCAGTGGFLIAGMNKMLKQSKDADQSESIKKEQIHGIEIREDLHTIATTNMILRGDGKSNLRRDDFLRMDTKDLQNINATVGLMNPPYSQAKNADTAHLSELNFINRLLDSMAPGGRVAVIVPQSTMVGKNNRDKDTKKLILKNHSLKSVITLNKETFYGVGTNPCIAVFTAHQPHNENDRVMFFNFEDDGYEVRKHMGLMPTELAKDRRKKLLDVYYDRAEAPSSFMVKSKVTAEDEWLHSFFYFNDNIPSADDFMKTMADYLTFEFDMRSHGKGYLFKKDGE